MPGTPDPLSSLFRFCHGLLLLGGCLLPLPGSLPMPVPYRYLYGTRETRFSGKRGSFRRSSSRTGRISAVMKCGESSWNRWASNENREGRLEVNGVFKALATMAPNGGEPKLDTVRKWYTNVFFPFLIFFLRTARGFDVRLVSTFLFSMILYDL